MKILNTIKRLGTSITDLVFPVSCLICGQDENYLCNNCLTKIPRLEKQQCLVCQKPAPFGKTHPECASRNKVDGALSALTHKDKRVHRVIWVFKYNFVSSLADPLAKLIIETINQQGLEGYFEDFTLVPVPLHSRRFNWRGFNQASLLAKALAEKLKISVDENLIERTKFTKPQVKLNADDRKRNIENAFKLNPDAQVGARKILLVDDVITSGSTAHEMAKILKQGKAQEIWIVSAAHG